ncbi:two-component system sensor histidine kinase AtoS [Spirochaetota bacterium]
MRLTTRLLLLTFLSVVLPMLFLSWYLKQEISDNIIKEKQDKLFGLARQLDLALPGTFNDILEASNLMQADRETKIQALNEALRETSDFVASGNLGVGVGYYCRDLDAIVTYSPSYQFQYTVGQSIFQGHKGYEVMQRGIALVQTGSLVRGNILNCMWPINRNGYTIGYIWANETVDMVDNQIEPIVKRLFVILAVICVFIYLSLTVSMKGLLDKILSIKKGLDNLFKEPGYHIPAVKGELSIIVNTVNSLVDNMNLMKSYNNIILESVHNGILAVSPSGTITWANRAFYELFPWYKNKLVEKDYKAVFSPKLKSLVSEIRSNGQKHDTVEFDDGGRVLELKSNEMQDDRGVNIGQVFVFRDLTTIRQYEKELREKERAASLGHMALSLVHEIKNPLTSVKGFAQLLKRMDKDQLKQSHYLDLIDRELNRVNKLLNEMLAYGAGSRLDKKKENLAKLAEEALGRWQTVFGNIECRIIKEAHGSFDAWVDSYKLIQVLDNILKNAFEALNQKGFGKLAVLLKVKQDSVHIIVVDTGIGISADNLKHIGEPLFSTKQGGNGFGLALSKKIVEAHGGFINIESIENYYTKISIVVPKDHKSGREMQ